MDDNRYFEDYTVCGELERIVKALRDGETDGVRDGVTRIPFRGDYIIVEYKTPQRHELLDSIDHFSLLYHRVSMLFNLDEEYYLARIENSEHHFMSVNTARLILSCMAMAYCDSHCFVMYGEDAEMVLGRSSTKLYSYTPSTIESLPTGLVMITLSCRMADQSVKWKRVSITEHEIKFPIACANCPVEEYWGRGIFTQANQDSIRAGLDPLMAPIILLSARGHCEEVITQSAVYLSNLAEFKDSSKRRLRSVPVVLSPFVDRLLAFISTPSSKYHIGERLLLAIHSVFYDYGFTEKAISMVSGMVKEFSRILREAYQRKDIKFVDIHEKPDWEEPLLFQKLSVIKHCMTASENDNIDSSSEPIDGIVIPKTQNHNQMEYYMTVDLFDHYQSALERFKSSDRARLHAAPLFSDMQAFKAANPTSTLVDFIKWHSPKDILQNGQLSSRICSVWTELWAEAEAKPVEQQEPLYVPWREAEKSLFYFEDLTVDGVVEQLRLYTGMFDVDSEQDIVSKSSLLHLIQDGKECLIGTEAGRDLVQSTFKLMINHVSIVEQCFVGDQGMTVITPSGRYLAQQRPV